MPLETSEAKQLRETARDVTLCHRKEITSQSDWIGSMKDALLRFISARVVDLVQHAFRCHRSQT